MQEKHSGLLSDVKPLRMGPFYSNLSEKPKSHISRQMTPEPWGHPRLRRLCRHLILLVTFHPTSPQIKSSVSHPNPGWKVEGLWKIKMLCFARSPESSPTPLPHVPVLVTPRPGRRRVSPGVYGIF